MLLSEIKESPLTLNGVGPSFLDALKRLNVNTIGDLLQLFPRDWEDRSTFNYLGEYKASPKIRVKAVVLGHSWMGLGSKRTLKIIIEDELSNRGVLKCFNRNFLQNVFLPQEKVIVTGAFYKYHNEITASSFEIEKYENYFSGIMPIYPLVEGLSQKKISSIINKAMEIYLDKIASELPQKVIEEYGLIEKKDVLRFMHHPKTIDEVKKARYSLIFEELFTFQYSALMRYVKRRKTLPASFNAKDCVNFKDVSNASFSPLQNALIKRLSFTLTEDQKNAILEINQDLNTSYSSSRLIQGDVGSGKTLVAFFASLYAIEKNWQVAFLSPTELLASQHAENASRLLSPLGINIAFLSGNVKAGGRALLLKQLKNGSINIIIGTHAIFSSDVEYQNLRLAIIDEQHKFGVLQREALLKKGEHEKMVNLIMMSATPIPRSLALSMFGDSDVSTIKTMPGGRKPIKTYIAQSGKAERVYSFVKDELKKRHQAYFIYPLIEESETLTFKAVEKMKEKLAIYFSDFSLASITSKTEEVEQKQIMQAFISGNIDILIATSIIEVGVDVPNATCIVIEDAQNFPLATLHQMRGRVGRSSLQSYCILIYENNLTENAYKRLKIMKETTDGFAIAEEDLKIRGPGNILGIEQSGYLGFKFANPYEDYPIMMAARESAINVIRDEMKEEKL